MMLSLTACSGGEETSQQSGKTVFDTEKAEVDTEKAEADANKAEWNTISAIIGNEELTTNISELTDNTFYEVKRLSRARKRIQ